jgi:hypothetical protein
MKCFKETADKNLNIKYLHNLLSSMVMGAKFSSELLLFIPEGRPIPTQSFFLSVITARVKS